MSNAWQRLAALFWVLLDLFNSFQFFFFAGLKRKRKTKFSNNEPLARDWLGTCENEKQRACGGGLWHEHLMQAEAGCQVEAGCQALHVEGLATIRNYAPQHLLQGGSIGWTNVDVWLNLPGVLARPPWDLCTILKAGRVYSASSCCVIK